MNNFEIIFNTYLSLFKNNIIKRLKKSVGFLTGHCTRMCCLVLQMYNKTNLYSGNYTLLQMKSDFDDRLCAWGRGFTTSTVSNNY